MKTVKLTILLSVFVLTLGSFAYAAESNEDLWQDGPDKRVRQRQREMTPEKIEQILDKIEERNPEKAEELRKLQQDDPEAFKNELRQMGKKMRSRRQKGGEEKREGFEGREHRVDRDGQGRGKGKERDGRKGMRESKEEFEQWLQENYPEKAVELEKLESENPEEYRQQLMTNVRQYGRLFRAEKSNPELAETLKADILAKEQIKAIKGKIKAATTEDEKKALATELETAVANRFDLIIKRKQQQVAEMQKKLEELQKKVIEKQVAIKELEAKKASEVKSRVESLMKSEEKVDWD